MLMECEAKKEKKVNNYRLFENFFDHSTRISYFRILKSFIASLKMVKEWNKTYYVIK